MTVSTPRVLYLNPTAHMGGAEHSLLDLAGSLDRRLFEPHLACFGEGPLVAAAAARQLAATALPLTGRFARQSLKGDRSGALELAAAALSACPLAWRVRRLAAGAAVAHTNGNKAHVIGTAVSRRTRLVWHVRDFWKAGRFEQLMVALANRRAGAVIANSKAVAFHLIAMGMRESLVHAVPNGIDGIRFSPEGPMAPLREAFGWPLHTPLVGITGMLARWKGQDVLLRAFAEVLRSRPEARCVVVGDEIYVTRGQSGFRDELRQLAQDLGIAHAVAFTGYRTDVPDVLRALDCVVHASVEPEPFGRVVAEAMACARPVIATDAGGVPEVTGPSGTAAMLVPCGDAPAMAAAIMRLLQDRDEALRLAHAGRARVASLFRVDTHVQHVQRLYAQLLEPATSKSRLQPV